MAQPIKKKIDNFELLEKAMLFWHIKILTEDEIHDEIEKEWEDLGDCKYDKKDSDVIRYWKLHNQLTNSINNGKIVIKMFEKDFKINDMGFGSVYPILLVCEKNMSVFLHKIKHTINHAWEWKLAEEQLKKERKLTKTNKYGNK